MRHAQKSLSSRPKEGSFFIIMAAGILSSFSFSLSFLVWNGAPLLMPTDQLLFLTRCKLKRESVSEFMDRIKSPYRLFSFLSQRCKSRKVDFRGAKLIDHVSQLFFDDTRETFSDGTWRGFLLFHFLFFISRFSLFRKERKKRGRKSHKRWIVFRLCVVVFPSPPGPWLSKRRRRLQPPLANIVTTDSQLPSQPTERTGSSSLFGYPIWTISPVFVYYDETDSCFHHPPSCFALSWPSIVGGGKKGKRVRGEIRAMTRQKTKAEPDDRKIRSHHVVYPI